MSGLADPGKSDLARDINSWLVAEHPDYVLGLQDLGELAAFSALGLLAVLHLSASYRLRKSRATRLFSIRLILWLAVFALFSVVLDMVHAMSRSHKFALGVVEDGGEMLTASVLVAMLLAAVFQQPMSGRMAETHRRICHSARSAAAKEGWPRYIRFTQAPSLTTARASIHW